MKIIYTAALILLPFFSFSQSIVSYHHSGQAAYAYEFNDRFRPEIRLISNTFLDDFFLKMMFNYDWIEKDDYEFYSGISILGSTLGRFGGPILGFPVGFNFYPFDKKNFGFLMEFSPNYTLYERGGAYFSGSLGIRYRFNKKEK